MHHFCPGGVRLIYSLAYIECAFFILPLSIVPVIQHIPSFHTVAPPKHTSHPHCRYWFYSRSKSLPSVRLTSLKCIVIYFERTLQHAGTDENRAELAELRAGSVLLFGMAAVFSAGRVL